MKGKISKHWNKYLEKFQPIQKDIYFTEEYVRLYETEKEKKQIIEEKIFTYIKDIQAKLCSREDLHDIEQKRINSEKLSDNEEKLVQFCLEFKKIRLELETFSCDNIKFRKALYRLFQLSKQENILSKEENNG